MCREEIIKEINLKEDECCIVLDFGCYFPYKNSEILTFEFSLGMEELGKSKINHRYPNKGYQTISKKTGRKVSKIGYPYVMKLDEQLQPFLLCIKVGIKGQYIELIFPIETKMTKEYPVCGLTMHYIFDDSVFKFLSYEYNKVEKCWNMHTWLSHEERNIHKDDIVLSNPSKVSDNTLIYSDIIMPSPQKVEFLML